jgi:VanZ family protein
VVRVYWKALAWNSVILLASLMPADTVPAGNWALIPHMDKIIHFIMYAVLTFFILQKNHIFFGKYRLINVLGLTFLYVSCMGFFIEILQNSFLIGRNFDIFDVLANTTGSLLVILGFRIFQRLNR